MGTKIFQVTSNNVTLAVDSISVTIPLSLLAMQDPGGVFLFGVNEYWKEVDGETVIHQIGREVMPILSDEEVVSALPGAPASEPRYVDLMAADQMASGAAALIPPSRAPYCDRIAEFQALMSAIEASAGVVSPAEKRRRLSQAVQGSEVFKRAYKAAKTSSAVNAALTMVVQFVTGAADIADEILFRYFADLVKELGELGAPHELTDEDMDALEQMFGSAGYDTARLLEVIVAANRPEPEVFDVNLLDRRHSYNGNTDAIPLF